MYKIYISLVIIFNTCIIADETSFDEMIDFIVQEQFVSLQEKTMRDSMYTMMETTGLKVKLGNEKARKSFAARHKCETANDKTTARYWACRLTHYAKQLGLSDGGNFFW